MLDEYVRRGAANRRRLSVWELVLRVAILLLMLGVVSAVSGWLQHAVDEPGEQRVGASACAVHGVAATTVMAPAARG